MKEAVAVTRWQEALVLRAGQQLCRLMDVLSSATLGSIRWGQMLCVSVWLCAVY